MKKTNQNDNSLQILDDFNKNYIDEKSVKNNELDIVQIFEANFSQWVKSE